jgi:hypothetical protein
LLWIGESTICSLAISKYASKIPETETRSLQIEPELYRLAINTSQLVLDKKQRAQSSDSEFFSPTTILADKESMILFDENGVRLETSYLIWNWLLLALEWPIRLGTNWEYFLRNVYLWPLDPKRIKVKGLGIDVFPWLAVFHRSPTTISLLEHCTGYLTYLHRVNGDRMRGILWDEGRRWPTEQTWYDPPKEYLFRSLLFLALDAENVPAVNHFHDRKELLLESSLPLLMRAFVKIEGEKAIESIRNPKTIIFLITIFLITIFARSSKMKQHLLRHSSLSSTYSEGLLNLHLNEIFTLMIPGSETEPEVPPPPRLSAILVQYNAKESYYEYCSEHKLRFIHRYRMMVDNVLTYGPLSDRTHLDLYLVGSLGSGNILAARKLVEHGARLTLQAENIRGDLVLEMYQQMSWRDRIKDAFLLGSFCFTPIAYGENLWDINWVFGGRFNLSWRDPYMEFKKKVDDMKFWNTGQKSIEVNEMLDKIDNELG